MKEKRDSYWQFFLRKTILLFALTSLVTISLNSHAYNFDDKLYHCYISSDMVEWQKVIVDLEKELDVTKSSDIEFQLLHAQYGFIGFLLGSKRTSMAEEYIPKADLHIASLLKTNPDWAEVIALEAAIIAYKISISPYKVVFLGPRSIRLLDNALELAPTNVYVLIEKGNYKHYAPSFVGGNPKEAIIFYQKAISNLNASNQTRTWWYLNTLTQIALAAEKAKDYKLASKTYREILALEPNFKWVKDYLYPQLLKKTGNV
jgi:tetratricopeptide (TPR) repeat protein